MVFLLNTISILSSLAIIFFLIWNYNWIHLKLFNQVQIDVEFLLYTVILLIPLQAISTNYTYLFLFQENTKKYNNLVILKSLVGSFSGILFLVYFDWGIFGILLGSLIGLFSGIFYGFLEISKKEKMVPFFKPNLVWEMIKYSFQHYLAGIIGHLQTYLTNLITALYLLPSQVAFFTMAKSQGDLITRMLTNSITTILYPKISKSNNQTHNCELTLKSFRISLLILVVIGSLIAFLIKPLVLFLYGIEYLPIIYPFFFILPGLIMLHSTTIFSSYYSGIGRPDLLPKISIIPLIIQTLILILLMPSLGITAAALSFLISSFVLSLIRIIVFYKLNYFNLKRLLVNKEDLNLLINFLSQSIKAIKTKR